MVVRKSDFTAHAQDLGIWQSLCELAGIPHSVYSADESDDIELMISEATKV